MKIVDAHADSNETSLNMISSYKIAHLARFRNFSLKISSFGPNRSKLAKCFLFYVTTLCNVTVVIC